MNEPCLYSDFESYLEHKVGSKYPDSDLELYMKADLESAFNKARKKYPDPDSRTYSDEWVLYEISKQKEYDEKLKRTSKDILLINLLQYLVEMATLMHRGNTAFRFRNGATMEWLYPKGDKAFRILNATEWRSSNIIMSKEIITLRDEVAIVSDHLTTLTESEKKKNSNRKTLRRSRH